MGNPNKPFIKTNYRSIPLYIGYNMAGEYTQPYTYTTRHRSLIRIPLRIAHAGNYAAPVAHHYRRHYVPWNIHSVSRSSHPHNFPTERVFVRADEI